MTPHISFYILSPQKQLIAFVGQLIATALNKSQAAVMVVAAANQLRTLDEQLWSFCDTAFIPHQIILESAALTRQTILARVILTDNVALVGDFNGVVINLTATPLGSCGASRLLEVVGSEPEQVASGREKYRYYQRELAQQSAVNNSEISVFRL